jgi:pSer/pThr/pTyr-binding forkhead associated (FHA) protein
MLVILEVISGPFQGKRIQAKVGETVRIGRTNKADVAMEDSFMSGEHFSIACHLRTCRLKDLNSRNGTQLNGKMITEEYLNDGDQVHAGRTDFTVQIEDQLKTSEGPSIKLREAAASSPPAQPKKQSKRLRPGEGSGNLPPASPVARGEVKVPDVTPAASEVQPAPPKVAPSPKSSKSEPPAQLETEPFAVRNEPAPIASESKQPEIISSNVLESYEAATPEGRLVHILSNQPGNLMALIDEARDANVIELLRGSSAEYQSLYGKEQKATIAPYLVRLAPRSELLKQMIQKGWGREWGVYLTSSLSLPELREFFRSSLMVTMPDGMELFSRFYDPRFFRTFLETCTAQEAEKFYGPITSYFMEDERPQILLQFSRSKRGAEKKGHLLSVLG